MQGVHISFFLSRDRDRKLLDLAIRYRIVFIRLITGFLNLLIALHEKTSITSL